MFFESWERQFSLAFLLPSCKYRWEGDTRMSWFRYWSKPIQRCLSFPSLQKQEEGRNFLCLPCKFGSEIHATSILPFTPPPPASLHPKIFQLHPQSPQVFPELDMTTPPHHSVRRCFIQDWKAPLDWEAWNTNLCSIQTLSSSLLLYFVILPWPGWARGTRPCQS